MSAPRIDIINAIFDSYLSMRNEAWHLYDEKTGKIKSPEEEKAKMKAEIVTDFIQSAARCKTTQDWIAYSAKLYEVECKELETYNNRSWMVKPFLDWPLLELTLKAIRAYIYSQVKNDQYTPTPESQGFMSKDEARNDVYHHEFFKEFIQKRDKRDLGESSFDDFAENVRTGVRKSTIADKLSAPSLAASTKSTVMARVRKKEPVVAVLKEEDVENLRTSNERKPAEVASAADVLRVVEDAKQKAAAHSDAIDKLLQETEEKVKADKEKAAQRSYAQVVASSSVVTADKPAVSDVSTKNEGSNVRSTRARRPSVSFVSGGPTLFAVPPQTPASSPHTRANENHTDQVSRPRKKKFA